MANELTYDPTEADASDFTDEELDSLQVGEQLAEQEQELLAGKYRDAQELEQAYLELQKLLGKQGTQEEGEDTQEVSEETAEDEEEYPEEIAPAVDLITTASAEYYNNGGQLSEETLEQFSSLSTRELVEAYMAMTANNPQQATQATPDLTPQEVNVIQNQAGGEQAYGQLVSWASEYLDPSYVAAYDSVVESGNVQAIQIALAGLLSEYERANGSEGKMYTGKAPDTSRDVFRSQAEVVRAMSDPRYDKDPAYRQDVFDKLERSNINY